MNPPDEVIFNLHFFAKFSRFKGCRPIQFSLIKQTGLSELDCYDKLARKNNI